MYRSVCFILYSNVSECLCVKYAFVSVRVKPKFYAHSLCPCSTRMPSHNSQYGSMNGLKCILIGVDGMMAQQINEQVKISSKDMTSSPRHSFASALQTLRNNGLRFVAPFTQLTHIFRYNFKANITIITITKENVIINCIFTYLFIYL